MPDYATWMLLWWASLATLLVAFALVDGFDLGIAMLFSALGHTEAERSECLHVVGPRSEGNGLWLLIGGGAFMAAWPVYATTFSIFWLALALTLGALFLRPLGFELRPLVPAGMQRRCWDVTLRLAGLLPAASFGLACGSLFDSEGAALSAFGVFCALLSVLLLALQGAAMLVVRTSAPVRDRARRACMSVALLLALLLLLGGIWLSLLPGPVGTSGKPHALQPGGWLQHYWRWPWLWLVPATGFTALLLCATAAGRGWAQTTWSSSCVALTAIMGAAGLALFPHVLPPSANISSFQLWQAAAEHHWLPGIVLPLALSLTTLAVARRARRPAAAGHENVQGHML